MHRRALMVALVVCAAAGRPAWAASTLNPVGIYGSITEARNCLNLVWAQAALIVRGPTVPKCPRMAFHDAGSFSTATGEGGANGSIMNELNFTMFLQNNGHTTAPPPSRPSSKQCLRPAARASPMPT
ncbi:hypothetical protein FOA52_011362 [Chlamydomonas sp. UWO 241]|nr:hypothetical protein FOA52_011362 [Chlamydomonas sp. UWO 241]